MEAWRRSDPGGSGWKGDTVIDAMNALVPPEELGGLPLPSSWGKLNEGGVLGHARGRTWGQLIFQDLFKQDLLKKEQ